MSAPAWMVRLRKQILARPGFSSLPTCPACQRPTGAMYFAKSGLCLRCEDERLAVWEAMRDAEVGTGGPAKHPPMYDCPEGERPFLPEEE